MRIVRILIVAVLVVLALPYALTPLYAVGHPASTLMIWRWITGHNVSRIWVDLDSMSPALPRLAVAAEDAKFCVHHGVDWDSLREVIDDAQEGEIVRGGSTITQQVAKNLFLWQGRSFIRKGLEFPLAFWIDFVLSKKRILELYLNIAELGPDGQFGAEAGAEYAFGRNVAALSASEAALLVASLPNPVTRSARRPGPGLRRMAGIYVTRAQSAEIPNCWAINR